jgi:DNA polymerase I-like protein with 3'-5' exonuclease and polymerase domains
MIIEERELKPLVLDPPPNITRVVDQESEDKLIDFLERTPDFGFDVETTPVKDFFYRRLRTAQFGNNQEQYVIDLKAYCKDHGDLASDLLYTCQGDYGKRLWMAPRLQKLFNRLSKYLVSNKWTKTGVNVSFEYECAYWLLGMRTFGYYDCMLAEKCIYAGLGGSASLKNYDYFSMESMFERYFGFTIDKTLQTSFNLEGELTDEQFEYAALDTRTPLAIKAVQNLIASGETVKSLTDKGKKRLAGYLYYLDRIILGDNLHEVIAIENEALGAFIDMHVHGERIDREKWLARVSKAKVKLAEVIKELDKIFLPFVGSKLDAVDDTTIAALELEWKALRDNPTEMEIELKLAISQANREIKKLIKQNLDTMELQLVRAEAEIKLNQLQDARLEHKEAVKKHCGDLSKKRTKIRNLAADCEGEALINYGSDAQLMHCLREHFKVLAKLEAMDDETLEKYESIPVMKLIREYHGLSKEVGTYGDSWATQWTTHACKEEGWLHPGDGRLHCKFNQYDAGTGRSSSSNPNGQNLPQDKEVRSSFVADPPNKSIRISNCCEADTYTIPGETVEFPIMYHCSACDKFCETHAEEYVLVTADMSGAELRIIADDANDDVWVAAFLRGEDVHSVGTELLYYEKWHNSALPDCAYFKLHTEETVAKNPNCKIGDPQRQKCKCPIHKELRDHNKATNFLLAYGGGPGALAAAIKQAQRVAKELMALHEQKNPRIWAYLDKSGKDAARDGKSFDLFGRRRLFPEPTHVRAKENCKEWNEKQLRLTPEDTEKNIAIFTTVKGRKPTQMEMFDLSHRQPTADEISRSWFQMTSRITRQGKNHRIQATNASIAKKAMGAGYCPEGKPFLWHTLPQYRAKLIKFVHDELVVQCPKQYGEKVAALIGDAFRRAAFIKMKRVVMEFEYAIKSYWSK